MTVATQVVATLDRALAQTGKVLAGVKADQFDRPTPCAKWNVRALVNHTIGGAFMFTDLTHGKTVSAEGEPPDFAAGDYAATWRQARDALIEAWNEPGVMDRTIHFPFGDLPAPAGLNVQLMETITHCWDLAKATGQTAILDDELAHVVFDNAQGVVPHEIRTAEGHPFGPIVSVPDGAPIYSRLAGFLGRQP